MRYVTVNGIVTYYGNFIPNYFDVNSETQCALTKYFDTDMTAVLTAPTSNPYKMLSYDPAQLIQLDNVGYDKGTQKY
jgi:hypothetical protein